MELVSDSVLAERQNKQNRQPTIAFSDPCYLDDITRDEADLSIFKAEHRFWPEVDGGGE
jgi:hypothetical protein